MSKFSVLIDKLIKESDLSGSKIGEIIGVSSATISMYRKEKRIPSKKTLEQLIEVLELTNEEEQELKLVWTLAKGDPGTEKGITKISDENEAIKKVLARVENEIELTKRIEELEEENKHLKIYEEIFMDLGDEEFKVALTGIKEKIILNAVKNNKLGSMRKKIKDLERLIEEL